tara:strand:- start:1316 stop:1669 length:354 start_codon:yes stop_codon:yes gene_type:complete
MDVGEIMISEGVPFLDSSTQEEFINKSESYIHLMDMFVDEFNYWISELGDSEKEVKFKKFYINEISAIRKLQDSVIENVDFVSENLSQSSVYRSCLRNRDVIITYLYSLLNIVRKEF